MFSYKHLKNRSPNLSQSFFNQVYHWKTLILIKTTLQMNMKENILKFALFKKGNLSLKDFFWSSVIFHIKKTTSIRFPALYHNNCYLTPRKKRFQIMTLFFLFFYHSSRDLSTDYYSSIHSVSCGWIPLFLPYINYTVENMQHAWTIWNVKFMK